MKCHGDAMELRWYREPFVLIFGRRVFIIFAREGKI
jgi:hypothetical protein